MSVYSGPVSWWINGTDTGRNHSATKIVSQTNLKLNLDAGTLTSYSGNNTWLDLSGSGYNGTKNAGVTANTLNGGVLSFNGTSGEIVFPAAANSVNLGLNSYHTAEVWCYPKTFTNDAALFSYIQAYGYNTALHYLIRSAKPYFGWYGIDFFSPTTLTANTWYHLAFVYDTDLKQKIYLNGVLDSSQNSSIGFAGTTATLKLGVYYSPHFFDGFISNARIYNRALSATEIQQNFNALRGRFGL